MFLIFNILIGIKLLKIMSYLLQNYLWYLCDCDILNNNFLFELKYCDIQIRDYYFSILSNNICMFYNII